MLIKALSWLFTPPKKTRSRSGSSDPLVGWAALALIILTLVG